VKRLFLTAACALVATAAIGCGGDDDEALTKAEFLKQGNAICAKGNKEIDAGANKTFEKGKQPSKAQITKFAEDTLIPSVESQIDQLRDLKPPSADEDQVNKILDEAESALDETKDDPSVFATNKDPFKKANSLAGAYGLKECAG
jgi:hypothetical protein